MESDAGTQMICNFVERGRQLGNQQLFYPKFYESVAVCRIRKSLMKLRRLVVTLHCFNKSLFSLVKKLGSKRQ